MDYVKIRSVHIVRTWTRGPGGYITLCGRRGVTLHTLPGFGDDKSCESCLRIAARNAAS